MTSAPQIPLTLETGRLSPELRTSMTIQNYILDGGELSPAGKAALQILEALIWGAKLQPTDETALFTMLGRLNGVSKDPGSKQAIQDRIPTVVLDTGVRTDHVLEGVKPATALGVIPEFFVEELKEFRAITSIWRFRPSTISLEAPLWKSSFSTSNSYQALLPLQEITDARKYIIDAIKAGQLDLSFWEIFIHPVDSVPVYSSELGWVTSFTESMKSMYSIMPSISQYVLGIPNVSFIHIKYIRTSKWEIQHILIQGDIPESANHNQWTLLFSKDGFLPENKWKNQPIPMLELFIESAVTKNPHSFIQFLEDIFGARYPLRIAAASWVEGITLSEQSLDSVEPSS